MPTNLKLELFPNTHPKVRIYSLKSTEQILFQTSRPSLWVFCLCLVGANHPIPTVYLDSRVHGANMGTIWGWQVVDDYKLIYFSILIISMLKSPVKIVVTSLSIFSNDLSKFWTKWEKFTLGCLWIPSGINDTLLSINVTRRLSVSHFTQWQGRKVFSNIHIFHFFHLHTYQHDHKIDIRGNLKENIAQCHNTIYNNTLRSSNVVKTCCN